MQEAETMPEAVGWRLGGWKAAAVTGVSYRQLDYWVRSGALPRPAQPATGKGTKRGFSFLDLIRARTMARLRAEGVSLQAIRQVMRELTDRYQIADPLTDTARLVVAGERVFWALDDSTLLDVLKGQLAARPLVLIEMPEIVREVQRAMSEMCAA
jgi:DNA-binding transcriptional MerR regulator